MNHRITSIAAVALAAVIAAPAPAATIEDIFDLTSPWLFIGTGSENDGTTPEGKSSKGVGDAVDISNSYMAPEVK